MFGPPSDVRMPRGPEAPPSHPGRNAYSQPFQTPNTDLRPHHSPSQTATNAFERIGTPSRRAYGHHVRSIEGPHGIRRDEADAHVVGGRPRRRLTGSTSPRWARRVPAEPRLG